MVRPAIVPIVVAMILALGACGGEVRDDDDARRIVRVRPEKESGHSSPRGNGRDGPPTAPAAVPSRDQAPGAQKATVAPEVGAVAFGPTAGPPLQLPTPPAGPGPAATDTLPDFAALYAAAAPSVVALKVDTDSKERQGTGFFIDPQGRVLTSAHVVEGARGITAMTQDGRRLTARIVGADHHTDLALLAVEGEDLPQPLPLATRDALPGEWVMAIGTPLGLAFSATRGIVSATGRNDVVWDPAGFADFIQTDAAINRGNSGGPLLTLDGAAIGVCAAIDPDADRIGFAVPASMARVVATHLQDNGRLVRSFLGVQLTEDQQGVRVVSVLTASPADEAGLRAGDRIRTWQGEPVDELTPFRWRVATTPPETEAALQVERGMLRLDLSVRTEEAPAYTGR